MSSTKSLNTIASELTFPQIAKNFKIQTPQQLRDQIIFNMLRTVLLKLEADEEILEILGKQEKLWAVAQAQGC